MERSRRTVECVCAPLGSTRRICPLSGVAPFSAQPKSVARRTRRNADIHVDGARRIDPAPALLFSHSLLSGSIAKRGKRRSNSERAKGGRIKFFFLTDASIFPPDRPFVSPISSGRRVGAAGRRMRNGSARSLSIRSDDERRRPSRGDPIDRSHDRRAIVAS